MEFEPHLPTPAYFEFELYIICEVLVFVIAILCHVLFLLLRSITKEKVRFEEGSEMTNESDFLFAHQFITSLFLSFSAQYPLLRMLDAIMYQMNINDDEATTFFQFQMPLALCQLISCPIMVFVSPIKPPHILS